LYPTSVLRSSTLSGFSIVVVSPTGSFLTRLDLAAARLGQRVRELDVIRTCSGSDLPAHLIHQFADNGVAGLNALLQGDIGVQRLTLDVMRPANHGRL